MALTKVTGDFIKDGVLTQAHLHTSHSITTSDIGEGSNLYFTTARVDSRIGDLSTSDLSEGSNLYYTQARFNTAFAAKSTSDLTEGTNLYYTNTRADARIALQVGSNLDLSNKSTSDLSEGTNLYYTDARARGAISVSGNALSYNSSTGVITSNFEESPTFSGNVVINGSGSSGNALNVTRGSDGTTALRVQNTGEVVTQANYFYATGPGVSMYVQNTAVFRGSILNDGSNAPVRIADDLTIDSDLTVTGGDITLGGTGRIQGIDTVSAGTDAANKTYVDNQVAGIVDSAPSTLDTLNELAAALGDDANFSTTVTNSIATKMPLAGGTFTGNVTISGTNHLELFGFLYTRSTLRVLNAAGTGWHNWATRAAGKYDLNVNNITAAAITASGNITGGFGDFTGINTALNARNGASGVAIGNYTSAYAYIDLASTNSSFGSWIDFSKGDAQDYGGRIRYHNSNNTFTFTTGGSNDEFVIYTTYTYSPGSSRSPIFYDSNDTTYYLDPALTGKSLKIAGGISTNVPNGDVIIKHTVSEANSWIFQENAANWGLFWVNEGGSSKAVTFGSYNTVGAEFVGFRQSSATNMINPSVWTGIDSNAHAAWLLSNYSGDFWTAGSQYSAVDMRAPIFYDSAATTYYVDPNSTSAIGAIKTAGGAQIGTTTAHKLVVAGNGNYMNINYDQIWNAGGNLHLQYSSSGNIDMNYGGGYAFSRTSLRAPIFYDWSDTSYYIDPNNNGSRTKNLVIHVQSQSWSEGIRFDMPSQGQWGGLRWARNGTSTNSGNWALGYPGNLGNIDDFTFYSGTGNHRWRLNHSGDVTVEGSSRAPIFYDSNDTNYYVDPNSTSLSGKLRSYLLFNDYGAGVVGSYSSYRYQLVFAMGNAYKGALDGTSVSGGYGLWYSHPNAGGVAVNLNSHGLMNIDNGNWQASFAGSTRAAIDMRAPIFYDQNNTGYYVDPNGTSKLSLLQINNGGTSNQRIEFYDNSTSGYAALRFYFNSSEQSTIHVFGTTWSSSNWPGNSAGAINLSAYNGVTFGPWNNPGGWVYNSGQAQFNDSVRSPIFYDSNDTNYFIDPASATNGFKFYSAAGPFFLRGQTHWDSKPGIDLSGGTSEFRFSSTGGNLNLRTDGWFIAHDYIQSLGALYGTILYDQNNTGFYLDPASTSHINEIFIDGRISFRDSVSTNDGRGLYFEGNTFSTAYAIFRESGTWSNPYPDLRIAFHTGIQLGANSGYNGIRFFTDYDMSSQVMSVNNGSDPLGGGNVYVNNSLQAGSSLRAPIFYDSGNTGYYVDPASWSNLSSGRVGSYLQIGTTGNTTHTPGINMAIGSDIYWRQSTYSSNADIWMESVDNATYLTWKLRVSSFDTTSWTDSIVVFNHNFWRGYVGILRSPEYPLDLNGQARLSGGYTTSDVRLKKNIRDNELGLSHLLQLRTRLFDWITDEEILGRTLAFQNSLLDCRGFIAQEVEEVVPELVDTSEGDQPTKSIDDGAVTAMMVKAIQEQQAIIDDLKARIEILENQ